MKYRKIALILMALLLCAQMALAGGYVGERVPSVEKHFANYAYSGVQALAEDIAAAGSPKSVDIRPAKVSIDDLVQLKKLLPDTNIFCITQVCGVEADTADTELDLTGKELPMSEVLTKQMACFPRLSRLVLYEAKNLDNNKAEKICENLPDVEVVWTVYFGKWELRTDALAFSTLNSNDSFRYDSKEYSVLRYCTKLRALDLGHNVITDISFLESMPDLKILILADNRIKDISPLAKCENLEYIELFMNDIVDLTPLSGLKKLKDLNLCHNKAVDASPLKSLTQLERLWLSYNREMPESETAAVQEALPNCLCNFTIYYSTHGNWRGHDRYAVVKYIFDHGEYLEWDADVPPIKEQTKNMRQ